MNSPATKTRSPPAWTQCNRLFNAVVKNKDRTTVCIYSPLPNEPKRMAGRGAGVEGIKPNVFRITGGVTLGEFVLSSFRTCSADIVPSLNPLLTSPLHKGEGQYLMRPLS